MAGRCSYIRSSQETRKQVNERVCSLDRESYGILITYDAKIHVGIALKVSSAGNRAAAKCVGAIWLETEPPQSARGQLGWKPAPRKMRGGNLAGNQAYDSSVKSQIEAGADLTVGRR